MKTKEIVQEVNSVFKEFLTTNSQRNTPERFAILNEIYKRNTHFNIEEMYLIMQRKKYRVSRATIYNTIELLLEAKLIRKHQFEKTQAQYEKCYFSKQHDHLICEKCHEIVEFCEPRIQKIRHFMEINLNFKITRHSLNLYGICKDCQENKK
ncbi:MAG: transcriptional repressor [Bacteroidota bacterium]|nr:transcriptional repressor [Bacteroidota bacterium]